MLTRRQLIQRLLTLTVAGTLPPVFQNCTRAQDASSTTGLPEPYASWTELRTLVRSSSDHFPARLSTAAAAGDWQHVYQIVRTQFVTLPNRDRRRPFDLVDQGLRAGDYACERAGAGTVLEQAMVLLRYLRLAGVEVSLYSQQVALQEGDYLAQLTRNLPPDFDAELPAALAQRFAALGDAAAVATGKNEADPLRERTLACLPTTEAQPGGKHSGGPVAVVVVTVSEDRYALPLLGTADQPLRLTAQNETDYRPAAVPEERLDVAVRISGRFRGQDERVFLEQTFPASHLAGRHLDLSFDHGIPLEALGAVSIGSLTTFTPILNLVRLPEDPLYREGAEAIRGEAFTVFGDSVESGQQEVRINGITPVPHPELSARVAAVRLEAQGTNYPEVQLRAWAYDAEGNAVEGLSAIDMVVEERGHRTLATLRQNTVPPPRVIILYDTTHSMPSAFREPAYIANFYREVEALVHRQLPTAQVDIREGNDEYYDLLAEQVRHAPDLIICFSDGRIIGNALPRHQAALAALPPLLFLHAGPEVHADLITLAEYVQTTPIAATDRAAIVAGIESALTNIETPPYRLSYYGAALPDAPTPVSITINERTATTVYEPFGAGTAPLLEGLYLDVEIDRLAQRFVLGGYDARISRQASETDAQDVHHALLGGASVYVEGWGATSAVVLDDLIGSRLTTQEMMEVENAADNFEAFQEAMARVVIKDPHCLSMLQVLPGVVGQATLTYPDGLRACIRQRKLNLDQGEAITRMSLLPTARWRTAADDPSVAFRRTFETSWELVRAEAALYPISTHQLLKEQEVISLNTAYREFTTRDPEWRKGVSSLLRTVNEYRRGTSGSDNYAVVGTARPAPVWFEVAKDTGEVMGILTDLTGGGRSVAEAMNRIKTIDAALQMIISASSSMGLFPMGAFFAVVAKWYTIAAAHITTLDATMDSRCEMAKAVKGAALDTVVSALFTAFVPRVTGTVAAIHGMVGAGNDKVTASGNLLDKCLGF